MAEGLHLSRCENVALEALMAAFLQVRRSGNNSAFGRLCNLNTVRCCIDY